jgi:hypothetical protein
MRPSSLLSRSIQIGLGFQRFLYGQNQNLNMKENEFMADEVFRDTDGR